MNVSVRANVRTAEAARARHRTRRWTSPSAAAPSPACWWSAWACSASPASSGSCTARRAHGAKMSDIVQAADRPRLRRLADLDLRATGRRHLHQGRRRRRRPGGQGRSRHSRGRSAQSRGDRRQRRRQRRRLRRHGGRPVRDLRRDHHRHHGAGRAAAVQARTSSATPWSTRWCWAASRSSPRSSAAIFVKATQGGKIMNALYRGLAVAACISLIAFYFVTDWLMRRRRRPSTRRSPWSSSGAPASSAWCSPR